MISLILSILMFIATLPVKGAMLAMKGVSVVKKVSSKASDALNSNASEFEKLKDKLSNKKASAKGVAKFGIKIAIRGLKALLLLIRGIAVILGVIGSVTLLIYVLVFALIVGAVGFVVVGLNGDMKFTQTLDISTSTSDNKAVKKEVNNTQVINAWLDACRTVWEYGHKEGWTYGSSHSTKKWGTVRADCSGYVSACLIEAGYNKKSKMYASGTLKDFPNDCAEWKLIELTDKKQIKRGDIVGATGSHANVYAGKGLWWDAGNTELGFKVSKGARSREMDWWKGSTNRDTGKASFCYILRLQTVVNAGGGGSVAGLLYPSKGGNVDIPWFCQGDYADCYLTTDKLFHVDKSGCLFTSMAMVLTYYMGSKYTPRDVVSKLIKGRSTCKYYIRDNGGVGAQACNNMAKDFKVNVKCSENLQGNYSKMFKYAKKGYPIICSVNPGLFTTSCHYIVVRGADEDGSCYVNDPNGRANAHRVKGWEKNLESGVKWLNIKWNLKKDVYNYLRSGAWAILPKDAKE